MLDREINQQSTKLPPYVVFCFGITYDCVKRVQASNNTLLDKPVNGVARPSNVESEAPNMRIDIQKRNMQQLRRKVAPHFLISPSACLFNCKWNDVTFHPGTSRTAIAESCQLCEIGW